MGEFLPPRALRLDTNCPVPWPAPRSSSSSSLSSLHVPPSSSSSTSEASGADDRCIVSFLQQQYFQCLWLGEQCFPLAAFPLVFDRMLGLPSNVTGAASGSIVEAKACLSAIASLLQTGAQVQSKYRTVLPAELQSLAASGLPRNPGLKAAEVKLIVAALASGPGSAVAAEHKTYQDKVNRALLEAQSEGSQAENDGANVPSSGSFRLRDEWLRAIERRELSLQLLLVLEALRLGIEHPSLLTQAQGSASAPIGAPSVTVGLHRPDVNPLQPPPPNKTEPEASAKSTKRKRKSAPARRWTGFPTALLLDTGDSLDDETTAKRFFWEKRSQDSNNEAAGEHGMVDEGEVDVWEPGLLVRNAERLHRLFEALVDRLSLRIVTADLSHDLAGIGDLVNDPVTPGGGGDGKRAAAMALTASAPLFGTAARMRDEEDNRDEMCHMCSDIVEPRFSRLLPRQCSIMRSRATTAAGGGLGSTPARPRHTSSNTASAERQRRLESQQLAQIGRETDLAAKKKVADEKARLREAKVQSQRPGLKDALVLEQKERKGRSSSVAPATDSAREVSVKRKVGFSRTSSTSSAAPATADGGEGRSSAQSQSAPTVPTVVTAPTSTRVLGASATHNAGQARGLNKRKMSEPRRLGGSGGFFADEDDFDGVKQNDGDDSDGGNSEGDNDSRRTQLLASPSKRTKVRDHVGPFSRSLKRSAAVNGWQRTESQPVILSTQTMTCDKECDASIKSEQPPKSSTAHPLQGLGALRSWSRSATVASLPVFPDGGVIQSADAPVAANAPSPPAAGVAASKPVPEITGEVKPRPPLKPLLSLKRAPSGRNPFVKTPSMPKVQLEPPLRSSFESNSQPLPKVHAFDSDGEEEHSNEYVQGTEGGDTSFPQLGRLWRGPKQWQEQA